MQDTNVSSNFSPSFDFYQWVNNKWLNDPSNQIPSDYSSWGGFTKLYDEGLKNQINIVKNLENNCSSEEEEKIFLIWKACQDNFNLWRENKSDYTSLINEFKILDEVFSGDNYVDNLAKYLHYVEMNGIGNLLSFDTGSDLKNVNNVVLDFSTGGLSLPSREYYKSNEFEDKLELFKLHLQNVKQIIEENTDITLDDNFVNNVLHYENLISDFAMKPDQSREYDKYYTNTTLDQLHKSINELNSLERKEENYPVEERNFKLNETQIEQVTQLFEKLYTLFDFRNILENNFNKNFTSVETPPEKFQISAYDGDSIRRCMKLILDTTLFSEYKSYMQYKIISGLSSFCSKDLNEEFFDFYSRKLGGQTEQKPEDKRSINIVNSYAGEMLGKIFVSKYFPIESKNNMKVLVDNVLSIMKESLSTNDWLTGQTKEKALEKLLTFRTKIGYPDEWKDYSEFDIKLGDSLYEISKKARKWSLKVNFFNKINSILDRNEWRMTPQTVNAYFMPTQNEIVFPAAILQPPFFHQDKTNIDFDISEELNILPDFDFVTPANYGGIGAVIAHEITHGYDDKGRKFDNNGNLNDWWNEDDVELFKNKTELMVNSVELYKYIDEESKEHKMNPQLTMGENLADIGGLTLSMKALLNKLKSENANDELINVSLRVFFKSWANVWKQNIKQDRRIMLLAVDPHAPTDFRGNLVQHIDEFYQVFNIKEGDKMFLPKENRMKMW